LTACPLTQAHHREGAVTDLHVAFSRLNTRKDYVQHHMLSHAAALFAALQAGAVLYVCGDAKHMAKDVHRALLEVVGTEGSLASAQAEAYVKALQTSGRYLQDVW